MGIKEDLKRAFLGTPEKKAEFQEDTLGQSGVRVSKDSRLEHRIALLVQLGQEVSKINNNLLREKDQWKRLVLMKQKLNLVNDGITYISYPWLRAIGDVNSSKPIRGWTTLYAIATNWISETMRMTGRGKENQKQAKRDEKVFDELGEDIYDVETGDIKMLIQFLERNLETYIFKDAFFLLGLPFTDADVTAQSVTVIQSMQPLRQQGIDINKESETL